MAMTEEERKKALAAQAAADRQAVGGVMSTVRDVNQRAGAAIADIATMPVRGVAGAYDSAVVRPMRAAGIDAAYLSPAVTPAGADPASMTPFYDRIRATDPMQGGQTGAGAGRGVVNPPAVQPTIAAPSPMPTVAGAGRGVLNPPTVNATERPDLADIPALSSAIGPRTGTPVAGAEGVRKITTANGGALYSNVPGTAGNDALMAGKGGVSVVPGGAGPIGGVQGINDRAAATYREMAALQQGIEQPGAMSNGAGMRVVGSAPSSMFSRTPEQQMQDRAFDTSVANTRAQTAMNLNPGRRGAAMATAITGANAEQERNLITADGNQLREQGANLRATQQELGANQRSANDLAGRGVTAAMDYRTNQARLGIDARRADLEEKSKAGIIAAQTAYLSAKTPVERAAAEEQMRAFGVGRDKNYPDKFTVVPRGTDETGRNLGAYVLDANGKLVDPGAQASPQGPAVGTVKSGYRFKGGNPADQKSWEKV